MKELHGGGGGKEFGKKEGDILQQPNSLPLILGQAQAGQRFSEDRGGWPLSS